MKGIFIYSRLSLWIFLVICLCNIAVGSAQTHQEPILPQEISELPDIKIKIKKTLALVNSSSNSYDAIILSNYALNWADSIGDLALKAQVLRCAGRYWKVWGDPLKSEELLAEALKLYQDMDSLETAAIVHRELGETFRAAGSYEFALKQLNLSKAYFETINDTNQLMRVYNRLAAVYLEQVIYAFKNSGNSLRRGVFQPIEADSIFSQYPLIKSSADSLQYFLDKALQLAHPLWFQGMYVSTMNIKASYLMHTKQFSKAESIYLDLLNKVLIGSETEDLPLLYLNLSMLHSTTFGNQPLKSIKYAKQGLAIAQERGIKNYELWANQMMHSSYAALDSFEQAYNTLQEAELLIKSFTDQDLALKMSSRQFEFLLAKREGELQIKQYQIALVVAFFLILGITFIVFSLIMANKNQKLYALNKQLNEQNQLISKQVNDLAAANQEKDRLFSIIAHDLRSPFSNLLGLTQVMEDEIAKGSTEDLATYARVLRESALQNMQLLSNLMEWARNQMGILSFQVETLTLADLLSLHKDHLQMMAAEKGIDLDIEVRKDHVLNVDRMMMSSVLKNLIENAIKFTEGGGKIEVRTLSEPELMCIQVKDSGVGIPDNIMQQLFDFGASSSRLGTNNEPSTGLGLMICKAFVERHGGKLKVQSLEGFGSTFTVELPI